MHIEDPPHRRNMVFQGVSALGKIMEHLTVNFWVTKAKYDELGADRAAKLLSKDM
jgi:actin-related protein